MNYWCVCVCILAAVIQHKITILSLAFSVESDFVIFHKIHHASHFVLFQRNVTDTFNVVQWQ